MTSLAGCLADDEEPSADGSDSDGGGEEGEPANQENQAPSPETAGISFPEPKAVSLDNEAQPDGTHDFSIEIENTGIEGDIGIMLVWLENPNDDIYGPNSAPVPETKRERFFSSGERRELSVTSGTRDGYDGYGFRMWATEIHVEIENEGGAGRVEARLMEGNEIIDDAELMMDAGVTISHAFESDFADVDLEKIDIEVVSAE